ncbi:MAG: alkaline phosphatase family protein [Gammaproteobacteria bacterium]|nr:alkaline phosphatase family protein [Gammaproteobacteria bacterium]
MTTLNKPDYSGGSIVNLMCSVADALGAGPSDISCARLLPADQLTSSKNIIFFVVDGLGYNYLTSQGKGSVFAQHLQGSLTSVFPTTTASAITSYFTCQTPLQHGLMGWYMYLKEINDVITVLPFKPRGSSVWKRLENECIDILYNFQSIFEKINVPSYVVTQKNIVNSVYSLEATRNAMRVGYQNLDDLFVQAKKIVSAAQEKSLIYCYWPGFDAISHDYGVNSAEAFAHFELLDSHFNKLLNDLRGTDSVVIVTADHGFIDIDPSKVIHLEKHPVLKDTLIRPLCGEPRVAYCYVDPLKTEQFEKYVNEALVDYCSVFKNDELIKDGYFGIGHPHPSIHSRIGDYVLIMKENYVIKDTLVSEKPFSQIGVHGGLSADELYVPLIVSEV